MELMTRVSEGLDRVITRIGKLAAWAGLAMILVTIFDVVTRRFFVLGSTKLQEAEWHFHTILFALCIGYAYLKDSHVRIDLIRENLSERAQWWIELAGCLFFLLPYCSLIIWFGIDFVERSYATNEISASATGLTHRWLIKSMIPLGFGLLALAGIAIMLRKLVELFGPEELRTKVHAIEEAEIEHLDDVVPPELRKRDGESPVMEFDFEYYLPLFMFAALGVLLFSGYPVAFVLGGVGLAFGFIGMAMDVFSFIQFFSLESRIWGGIAENLVLTAIPMFIFMGTMLERSGVASDLLYCLQVLLRRVPGGLALSVTLMGTIMAATTGIIGASVVMMTLLALPVMLKRDYNIPLATGTIAASGTLGILIPPSIMLVIMAELLARSVGNLFVAAIIPGFMLASFYMLYLLVLCSFKPQLAPPLPDEEGPDSAGGILIMVLRSFIPPLFLVFLVLGSILFGWATPTEAAGVGGAGAIFLALLKGRLNFTVLKDVVERSALTGGMLFGIFLGATCFSYVFRVLGGDFLVTDMVEHMGLGPWGLLFVLMGLVFFLGFFFDWIEITLIVLPVFSPIIAGLDFGDHVTQREVVYWFAILLAVNLQTSFLTPPFGFALFYMKGVAPPEVRIQQIYKGIIPFVLLQLVGLGLVVAFPDIALWLPRVLLN